MRYGRGYVAAYYNEIDPFAAAWLRELIKAGLIADGTVDERSIEDVRPDDLRGFTQCHFFAGIGGWSLALRLAGWADDRHVWTGSCPCQPFSVAGANSGAHDPRDLWPTWRELIRECRPRTVFGEQVEAAIAFGWWDRVCDDLEGEGYAVAPVCLPAASVGAPQLRERLYFVADASREGRQQDAASTSRYESQDGRQSHIDHIAAGAREGVGRSLADTDSGDSHWGREPLEVGRNAIEGEVTRRGRRRRALWRVKPGLQLLAYGLPNRVGRLGGFGNAIVPQVAAAFIEAYLDTVGDHA
jgi:DNA (cytosine-5)-methyltransferase 1